MTELDAFREEVRRWIEKSAPPGLKGHSSDPDTQIWGGKKERRTSEQDRWLRAGVERGFTAPTWPKEYGGGGLSKEEAAVLTAELQRLALPAPLTGFGLTMIGPTLLQFGTEEQKRLHLTRIARGEIRWCQGYSEPNAGSDLASLQCSAVDRGDHYVLNGQKTWTSYGDKSDWMFILVRTDPSAKKQQGITFLLFDLASPGVTIRPILLISGASPFTETFLDNVTVPKTHVVSDVNRGWTVAKALLGHEREMIAGVFGSGRGSTRGDVVVEVARRYAGNGAGVVTDPILRDRVAQLLMDQTCFEQTVKRTADAAKVGRRPGAESSLFKVYATELNQRRQELLCSLRGPQSVGWEGDGFEREELTQTREWLRSRGNTIEGGTSEIQLNIIAKGVLGLPD
jgi:alkylation response protein AidB-like acyl-CoA dehydrogenase